MTSQLSLFNLDNYTNYNPEEEPPDPDDYQTLEQYEYAWNKWQKKYPHLVAETQGMTVLEQESNDTSQVANHDSTVLEQEKGNTNQVAPEQCHWLEKYSVTRYHKEHYYYRYVWMSGRKLHHVHIGGGNFKSAIAIGRKAAVVQAIADGHTPMEIEKLIHSWRDHG